MNQGDWITVGQIIGTMVVFTASSVWFFATWISRQFSTTKAEVLDKIENLEKNIISKLEYHEHHDDSRFSEVRKDIFEIKIRNAARDGVVVEKDKQ